MTFECIIDEDIESKDEVAYWFDAAKYTPLFYINKNPIELNR